MATERRSKAHNAFLFAIIASALLSLTACATQQAEDTAATESSDNSAEITQPEVAVVDDYDGDGMELTIDGSSLEAFDASMARIKKHSPESTYQSLEAAVAYLMVYDLAARGNKEKLVLRLDGLNGYEVMERVGWRKPPPGESKIKKGAADAKMVET
jgi:hypothetical protein